MRTPQEVITYALEKEIGYVKMLISDAKLERADDMPLDHYWVRYLVDLQTAYNWIKERE